MEFEYDASGQTFTYFILAALAIYLVPATLSRLRVPKKSTRCFGLSDPLLLKSSPSRNFANTQALKHTNTNMPHRE